MIGPVSKIRFFKVAGHVFSVDTGALPIELKNCEPFELSAEEAASVPPEKRCFDLVRDCESSAPAYEEEIRQEEEGQTIICGHTSAGESVFDFRLRDNETGILVCSKDYRQATLYVPQNGAKAPLGTAYALNNSLMVLYALATAPFKTVLFHAAVVSFNGRGYMFLGKSGTGKSTHARLWLKHIEGTELLNDDNPVVRYYDDGRGAVVYGSPWSGKTPCYKNLEYPLGGIVLLAQAPYNKLVRLSGLESYAALITSISGKRWDKAVADGLHATENALAKNVPVWHLECLPDEAAAKLCNNNVIPSHGNSVIPGHDPESRWRLKAAMTMDECVMTTDEPAMTRDRTP